MRISDWSSDVCSSDLLACLRFDLPQADRSRCRCFHLRVQRADPEEASGLAVAWERIVANLSLHHLIESIAGAVAAAQDKIQRFQIRSEEHTSELQSLMRNSYAVFCLKKKKNKTDKRNTTT